MVYLLTYFIAIKILLLKYNSIKQLRGKVVVLLADGVLVELASSWWKIIFRKPVAICWRGSDLPRMIGVLIAVLRECYWQNINIGWKVQNLFLAQII